MLPDLLPAMNGRSSGSCPAKLPHSPVQSKRQHSVLGGSQASLLQSSHQKQEQQNAANGHFSQINSGSTHRVDSSHHTKDSHEGDSGQQQTSTIVEEEAAKPSAKANPEVIVLSASSSQAESEDPSTEDASKEEDSNGSRTTESANGNNCHSATAKEPLEEAISPADNLSAQCIGTEPHQTTETQQQLFQLPPEGICDRAVQQGQQGVQQIDLSLKRPPSMQNGKKPAAWTSIGRTEEGHTEGSVQTQPSSAARNEDQETLSQAQTPPTEYVPVLANNLANHATARL